MSASAAKRTGDSHRQTIPIPAAAEVMARGADVVVRLIRGREVPDDEIKALPDAWVILAATAKQSKGGQERRRAEVMACLATRTGPDMEAMRAAVAAADVDATVSLAEIRPRPLRWTWPGRIPRGKLTTLAGAGGVGKTLVVGDMIARKSTGRPWPDRPGEPNAVGSCILISAEDDAEDTIVPRLMAAGADLTRVRTLSTAVKDRFTLADLETLGRAVEEAEDVELITIDPPTAYIGKTDDHRNAELRALLGPLSDFAAKRDLAIVLVTHVSKSDASRASNRVIGSVAWINAVRAAWMFHKDKDDKDRRLILAIKSNLAKEAPGLAYRIVSDVVHHDSAEIPTARIEWEAGVVEMDADDACAAEGRRGEPKEEAAAKWLRTFLAEFARPSDVIFAEGKEAGFGKNLLYDAKRALDIRPRARGFGKGWYWGLGDPERWVFEDDFGPAATGHAKNRREDW